MASSDFDTYGRLHAKSAFLSQEGLRIHLDTDDTKTITLKATPSQVGDVEVTLPTAPGELLNGASNLAAAKLTGLQALGQPGVADADVFVYADADDANNPKGVAASDLKTYCNAGNESLPSGSQNGQMVFYDNDLSQWSAAAPSGDISADKTGAMTVANGAVTAAKIAANVIDATHLAQMPSGTFVLGQTTGDNVVVSLSGDATMAESGALTIASGAIDNAKVAAGAAIEKSKLAALNIADADVAAGANIAKSKLGALEIENADVAAGAAIAGSKVAPDFGAQKVETTGDVEAGSASAFYLGDSDSDGSWRIRLSGPNIVFEKRETGTWNQKGSFTA